MKLKYVGDDSANPEEKSIFLAGPSPRTKDDPHWRPEAIEILRKNGFSGQVFSPLTEDGGWLGDDIKQTNWELKHLDMATVVLFWVPRDREKLPGFTTNVEYGMFVKSGKAILGYPKNSDKMQYLDFLARRYNVQVFHDLEETLRESISLADRLHS